MRSNLVTGLLGILLLFVFSNVVVAQLPLNAIDYGNNKAVGKFIEVDGAKQYFEVYGKGEPLVLIHGNGGNIAYMKPQIDYFSKNYMVVVMDCRGRGKSELGNDSLTYMQITKDVVAIMDYLHLDSAYVVGRSDGGIIGLMLAIYYPEKVKKVVAFAANLTPDTLALYPNFYNEVIRDRNLADDMLARKDTLKNWKIEQQRNRMMEFQPRITAGELKRINCPVLVMSTDRDIIKEEHTVYIYRNIMKANLCFLSGEDHYVTKNNPALFNLTVENYLSKPFQGEEIRK